MTFLLFHTGESEQNQRPIYRKPAWAHFCQNDALWKNSTVLCKTDFDSTEQLYEVALTFRFMVSPHGVGLDCYRTWEALYLGMIPIVKTSNLDSMYEDLPVLIVKDWTEVTPELLERTWQAFQHKEFDFRRLYMGYWQWEMTRHRDNPNIAYEYS